MQQHSEVVPLDLHSEAASAWKDKLYAFTDDLAKNGAYAQMNTVLSQEEKTFGWEGQDKEAQQACMRVKEARPAGDLQARSGATFPTQIRVDSLNNTHKLKGSACEGCGLFTLVPQAREQLECVREVPKLLHFIWLDHPLPEKYAKNIASVMRANPDRLSLLWVNHAAQNVSSLARLLEGEGGEVASRLRVKSLEAHKDHFRNWDKATQEPNVGARSDWLRLEVLYLHGGIYLDTDFNGLHSFSGYGGVFRWPFVAYSDPKGYGNLCNCIMSAEKRSPFVNFVIEGWRSSGVTGPAGCPILTAAFVTYNQPEILMLSQDYMFLPKAGVDPVITSTFDGSWLPQNKGPGIGLVAEREVEP